MRAALALGLTGCVSFAIPDGPACGTRELNELESNDNERDPWLSPDRLEIIFASDRLGGPGGYDLWRATRISVDDAFGTPALLAADPNDPAVINTIQDEMGPFIAADNSTLYFTRDGHVMIAHRIANGMFDAPIMLGLDGDHVSLSVDQRDIYYSVDDTDIMTAHRDTLGDPGAPTPFGAPTVVNVRDLGRAGEPSLAADGQTLLFSADDSTTERHIARATRGATGEFGHVELIDETEPVTGHIDRAPQLHRPAFDYPDETIVFATNRFGGFAGLDLWIACE